MGDARDPLSLDFLKDTHPNVDNDLDLLPTKEEVMKHLGNGDQISSLNQCSSGKYDLYWLSA